ncbi:serine threonine- kinase SRPK3 [Lecanosticta acicola]|uniref:Serine threonine- kinase SRPK3 n=1 Tax=Lecanosticta acicola TaxID=111012 RepID=A0AAI8Z7V4_9PEZI|nr:serine threonine- kinase SRPK3 [Lecanosticta acicola]
MAKTILRDALSGLAFLHKHDVVHGDFQPGNILFSLKDLDAVGEEKLCQDPSTISEPLCRLDGKLDPWAPKYLALAFYANAPPPYTVTPVALRAPELIFNETPFGSAIDIWAFGCLVYEFVTGTRLFAVDLIGDDEQDDADDDHILDLTDVIGPLPERFMSKWTRRDRWIGPGGERLQPREDVSMDAYSDGDDELEDPEDLEEPGQVEAPGDSVEFDDDEPMADQDDMPEEPFINESLEAQFDRNKPDDIDEEEGRVITDLIREILQCEPDKRPTAEHLLRHHWFNS